MDYNRYIYKSKYRLVLNEIELLPIEKKIIVIMNELLFKGACHLKRAQGITAMPDWIMKNKHIDFLKKFKELLARHYKYHDDYQQQQENHLTIETEINHEKDQQH